MTEFNTAQQLNVPIMFAGWLFDLRADLHCGIKLTRDKDGTGPPISPGNSYPVVVNLADVDPETKLIPLWFHFLIANSGWPGISAQNFWILSAVARDGQGLPGMKEAKNISLAHLESYTYSVQLPVDAVDGHVVAFVTADVTKEIGELTEYNNTYTFTCDIQGIYIPPPK